MSQQTQDTPGVASRTKALVETARRQAGVTIKQVNPKEVSTAVHEFFQFIFLWVAHNIVPTLALLGLLALAVLGTTQLLGNLLNHEQSLLASVFVVAVFASLAFTHRKQQNNNN